MATSELGGGIAPSENQHLLRIPQGVFSRFYPLAGDRSASVAYHTPSQSVAFFEGDSAEVWWRIYQAGGGDGGGAGLYCQEWNF